MTARSPFPEPASPFAAGAPPARRRAHACALALALACLAAAQAADEPLAIQAARIITLEGPDVEDGVVLVEGGRIRAVGKGLEVPWNARTIRTAGVVAPGFIHPHSTAGLRVQNENLPEVPYISVLDGIDPNSPDYRSALRDGFTALHVIPGNATRFGGQGAVLRPVGALPEAMVVRTPSALKVSLAPSPGETRMAQMAHLRRGFQELHEHLAGLLPASALLAVRPPAAPDLSSLLVRSPDWKLIDWTRISLERIEEKRRPLADLVRGVLPAFIYCPRASDVFKAFELMDGHGLRATLVLGPDGFRAAQALKARAGLGPVVIDPELVRYEEDPETGEERRYLAGRIFHQAGVPFCLQPRDERGRSSPLFSGDPASHIAHQAARLVQQGVPAAEALRSATLHPARALGLEHRMGSIAPGKDADLVVTSGDPLDARSWVELVLIEGRVVYRRDEDRDLQELLRRPERRY